MQARQRPTSCASPQPPFGFHFSSLSYVALVALLRQCSLGAVPMGTHEVSPLSLLTFGLTSLPPSCPLAGAISCTLHHAFPSVNSVLSQLLPIATPQLPKRILKYPELLIRSLASQSSLQGRLRHCVCASCSLAPLLPLKPHPASRRMMLRFEHKCICWMLSVQLVLLWVVLITLGGRTSWKMSESRGCFLTAMMGAGLLLRGPLKTD